MKLLYLIAEKHPDDLVYRVEDDKQRTVGYLVTKKLNRFEKVDKKPKKHKKSNKKSRKWGYVFVLAELRNEGSYHIFDDRQQALDELVKARSLQNKFNTESITVIK